MLITRKDGQLRIYADRQLLSEPALDLGTVMCANGERGLQDVAVHPDFSENGYIFLYYTFNKFGSCDEESEDSPVNRLARFVLDDDNTVDPDSETVFFDTPQLPTDHHNAGDIEFGNDGNLYVTVGDGGVRGVDWHSNPGYLVGKIIRLTADGDIPDSNPFTGADSVRCNEDGRVPDGSPPDTKCQEVFALGFRNPFRFGFDPNSDSVRFYVNDVGVNTWEEISEGPVPGGNYGWNMMEGPCRRGSTTDCDLPDGFIDPVHWYANDGSGAAITGGAFVPDGLWPSEYDGAYLYGRFVQGKIRYIVPGATGCRECTPPTSNFIDTPFTDVDRVVTMVFGPYEDSLALYYTTRGNEIRRIVYVSDANRSPVAVAQAFPNAGPVPLTVQFEGRTSSDPDGDELTYAWDFGGDGAIDSTEPAPSYEYLQSGTYTVTLTVSDGNGGQDTASILITATPVSTSTPVPTATVTPTATAPVGQNQQMIYLPVLRQQENLAMNTLTPNPQSITSRPLQSEDDFWRVHQLLVESYPITPLCFNWEIRRWEGKRFYEENPRWPSPRLAGLVQLWETTAGRLVGAVHPDGEGDAHLQVHPDFRQLETPMVAWAEEHLTAQRIDGRQQLEFFVYEYDTPRQQLLIARGYTKTQAGGVMRRLRLADHPRPAPNMAPGYTLRTTHPDDLDDCQQIADLLNAAFTRDFHNAQEYQNFTRLAPSFRPDLDLVAVAPDGAFAAYVGIPYDTANRHGIFEPVCTHPDHRRRGLAGALMREGLRRLHALGARDITVETGAMIPANRLYDSIGFGEVCKGRIWRKVFAP